MILYVDTFVTNQPLSHWHNSSSPWGRLRNIDCSYRHQNKLDVFKYTLTSYSYYNWSDVYIRYELEDSDDYEETNRFIKDLFPDAIVENVRSSNQRGFLKAYTTLNKFEGEWYFYSPNNDHPFNTYDLSIMDTCLDKAKSFKGQYKNRISVFYSHFDEFVHLPYPGNWFSDMYNSAEQPRSIVDDDEDCVSMLSTFGDNTGVQIVHKELFKHWFLSRNLGNARVIRPECVRNHFLTRDHLSIMPKREICAHYDGQPSLQPSTHPPLFLPDGFFEKDMKLRYGFDEYKQGAVNINPTAEKYSFEDNIFGTDLKKTLKELPFFWKDFTSNTEIS